MVEVTIKSIAFRCSFTAGYRPVQLNEAEPFVQFADRVLIFGDRNGNGRVEIPFDRGSGGGGGGPANTDALLEGVTNLYFTQARVRAAIQAGGALSYNQATGLISYSPPALSSVAISGLYTDLMNRPTFAAVATSGRYDDLQNKPVLATVATSGLYSDLGSRPTLAAVATSGSASDLATGTLPAARLPTTGVSAGTYGSGTLVPVVTVDATGRITGISTVANAGNGGSGPSSTDALPEGTSNLYFTQARARAAISASGSLAYNSTTGVISYTAPTLAAVATSGSASDLTTGTLASGRFPTTGVTAGSYTAASITVDATGRVTAAANGPVAKQTNAFQCIGKPAAGEVLGMIVADVPFTIPANFATSQARALAAATASASVSITRIPAGSTTETTIGTLTWAANGTIPTFSTQAAVAFAAGDTMRCIAPSTQDSTLGDFGISIYGAR